MVYCEDWADILYYIIPWYTVLLRHVSLTMKHNDGVSSKFNTSSQARVVVVLLLPSARSVKRKERVTALVMGKVCTRWFMARLK